MNKRNSAFNEFLNETNQAEAFDALEYITKVKKKKRRRLSKGVVASFIIFELIFTAVTAPVYIYHGFFNNLKRNIVGAAMFSMKHQYLATMFLSTDEINSILDDQDNNDSQASGEDISAIKIDTSDSNIECKKVEGRKFDGYLLIIHDPTRVKVGYTQKLGIQGEKTSEIAKEYSAVAAINGGGFTDKSENSTALWTGTGAYPMGLVMSDGKVVYPKEGYPPNKVIDGDIAGLTSKGLLVIGRYSLNDLKKKDVKDAIMFGPALIVNGKARANVNNQGTAPRTAIGQRKDGAIIFLVADGRQALKPGATITDIQNLMIQEGAYNAINLDGGASTTMYYKDRVINSPSDKFGERPIPTVFYVK